MLLSPEHEILEINEAGIQALQSNRKDIIGKKCYRLVHNQEFPIKECPCTRMVGSKKIEVSEYSERGRVYELTAWPILDENNELKAFAHIVKDITERKEMEKENEKMQNQLLQAQKMEAIGTLVGGVAHEINNPLTAISMNIALLADIVHRQSREHVLSAPVYEQAMKKINVIEGETNKTSGIVKSLLMLSRKSRGEKELTQVNMNNILNATLSIAENQLGLDNIHIVKELGTDLPDVTVNENQIGQVFLNLINNAHDAMLPVGGTLTIKTRCHSDPATAGEESRDPSAVPQDDKSGIIEISFSDTGYGISQEDLNKIFDPFFTTKEPGKGTGLGLSVSQNIIKNHKGEILVESKPGIGTTFTVRLPETAR